MRSRTRTLAGWAAVAMCSLAGLAACGDRPAPAAAQLTSDVDRETVSPSDAVALPDLVAAADALGLQMLALGGAETTVTSPASLQVTLSMLAEGADGATLAELETLVGAAGPDRGKGVNALTTSLADLDGDPSVVAEDELPADPVVHRASRLVLDDALTVRQTFVDALARSYDAPAQTTDLGSDDARAVLDAWVKEHTGGLVPRSAIVPGPELQLALQDAVVLAARWEQPFLAELTHPAPFTLSSGEEVEVDMMSTGEPRETAYAEVDGWQAVRLPYTGGRLAAEVLLPPHGTSPADLDTTLLSRILSGLDEPEHTTLLLRMPTVDGSSSLDLLGLLEESAPSALRGGFSGISDQPLLVSQAVQQGVLVIDEDGTVAAAVTEMGMAGSAPIEPPLEVVVDRPYLVRVADRQTGWPLFLANVADPRGEEE